MPPLTYQETKAKTIKANFGFMKFLTRMGRMPSPSMVTSKDLSRIGVKYYLNISDYYWQENVMTIALD